MTGISVHDAAPQVVDLFSGAGGFSLGALNAGARIVFSVEFDKSAATTYRRNICGPDGPALYADDIAELDANRLALLHFPGESECDLLLGGPPCQGFSVHRTGNSGIGDDRNELIYRYFDFIRALRPKAFLMENVPGMLRPEYIDYLNKFRQLGKNEGYTIFDPAILDARDFGVPQRRKRVFILGVRDCERMAAHEWPPVPTHSKVPSLLTKEWRPCRDVFLPAPAGDLCDVHMQHGRELTEIFRNTPANGGSRRDSGRILPCHVIHDGHKDVYGRIDVEKPAPTMTGGCINPSKGRFVHPVEHHGITVRQAARIQTFPDHFVFKGGLIASGKQIGNAVPVVLAEKLVRHVLAAIM